MANAPSFNVEVFPPELGYGEFSNFMMFQTFAQLGGVGQSTSDINFSAPEGQVCLPIPSGVGTTYEQGWEQEEVGLGGAAAGTAGEVIAGRRGVGESGAEIIDQGRTALGGRPGVMQAVGKVIGVGNATTQRATGRATFNNTYMTYSGPAFRDFSYNFSLKPLSKESTEDIRRIVRFFKINAAPIQRAMRVSRIYEIPKLFGITYHGKSGPMEHMNRIGKCALTSINVIYGGDRFAVFDQDSAPVQVDLTLQFKEVQLLSSADMAAGF